MTCLSWYCKFSKEMERQIGLAVLRFTFQTAMEHGTGSSRGEQGSGGMSFGSEETILGPGQAGLGWV